MKGQEDLEANKEDFPGGTVGKSPPASAEDMNSISGPGRSHVPRSNQSPCMTTAVIRELSGPGATVPEPERHDAEGCVLQGPCSTRETTTMRSLRISQILTDLLCQLPSLNGGNMVIKISSV